MQPEPKKPQSLPPRPDPPGHTHRNTTCVNEIWNEKLLLIVGVLGPLIEPPRDREHGRHVGRHANQHFEEEPGIGGQIRQRGDHRSQDPRRRPACRFRDELSQPFPSRGGGDIDDLPHPVRAQPKQRFRSTGIVAAHECHGWKGREAPHQLVDLIGAIVAALVHREENGVDRPFPHDPHDLRHRVTVQNRKGPETCRVEAGPLAGGDHGGDGRVGDRASGLRRGAGGQDGFSGSDSAATLARPVQPTFNWAGGPIGASESLFDAEGAGRRE